MWRCLKHHRFGQSPARCGKPIINCLLNLYLPPYSPPFTKGIDQRTRQYRLHGTARTGKTICLLRIPSYHHTLKNGSGHEAVHTKLVMPMNNWPLNNSLSRTTTSSLPAIMCLSTVNISQNTASEIFPYTIYLYIVRTTAEDRA